METHFQRLKEIMERREGRSFTDEEVIQWGRFLIEVLKRNLTTKKEK